MPSLTAQSQEAIHSQCHHVAVRASDTFPAGAGGSCHVVSCCGPRGPCSIQLGQGSSCAHTRTGTHTNRQANTRTHRDTGTRTGTHRHTESHIETHIHLVELGLERTVSNGYPFPLRLSQTLCNAATITNKEQKFKCTGRIFQAWHSATSFH